jgi:hypothetical protein
MVGGVCMDGFECGPAEEVLFAGFFCSRPGGFACERYLFLLPERFVPAGGGCFCFPGGLCLREVCSFASRIWLVGPTPGECRLHMQITFIPYREGSWIVTSNRGKSHPHVRR